MLQAALGGYKNVSSGTTVLDDFPVFHEPGFTLISPLEIEVPESDQVYILLRTRVDETGEVFETPIIANFTVTIKDVTTGERVPGFLDTNEVTQTVFNGYWDLDVSQFNPIVLVINNSLDVFSPIERVRVLDVFVKNKNDAQESIFLRLIIDDSNKFIHYINVNIDEIGNRSTFTSFGREVTANVTNLSDSYILFSPFAYLKEVDSLTNFDFSYPLESVFYKRQKTFNEEEFDLSITSVSHDFINDNVSLMSVPKFKKAGILLIDKYIHTEMLKINARVYLDILVSGLLSGITETFRIYFVR